MWLNPYDNGVEFDRDYIKVSHVMEGDVMKVMLLTTLKATVSVTICVEWGKSFSTTKLIFLHDCLIQITQVHLVGAFYIVLLDPALH